MTLVVHLLAGLAIIAAAREQAAVTPVQKVLQLLTGMVEKGKDEKHQESVQFATFKKFCKTTSRDKERAIKEANEQIAALEADIQKYEADAEKLGKEIKTHDEEISTWEGNLKAATEVRDSEAADYTATFEDYGDSIGALEEGIADLKAKSGKTAQASLAQLAAKDIVPAETRRVIGAFLANDPDETLAIAAPESAAYEGQSQGILDMLDGLLNKFEDERSDLEKMEMNAKFAFELLAQDLKTQIAEGTQSRTEKTEAKGEAEQNAAEAKGALADTTATRDDDSKYLSDLTANCEAKSSAFEERQQLRAEEIAAVEKAIEILSSGAVAGAADAHLPALLQRKTSLAQLRSVQQNPAQLRVAAYLRDEASRIGSHLLTALAVRVHDDPMKKVKKMIQDLVVKLMEEANEEAEHKGWCDTEMTTNEQTRKEKTDGVELLTASVDELTASVSKLTREIVELSRAVAELDAAMAKATSIREAEKEKNTATIKDAQDAQVAVAQALSVLKDFYEKAGEATALAQQQPESPEIFDEPYKGMGSENGGVVGMIEVIQSDFARLESDTTAGEEQAQKEYDEFMADSSTDKAQKSSDLDHKNSHKQNDEKTLAEKKTDLTSTQTELDAAMEYYEKLKPSCVDAGVSYEDRVARRKEEIESLNEALKILTGEE